LFTSKSAPGDRENQQGELPEKKERLGGGGGLLCSPPGKIFHSGKEEKIWSLVNRKGEEGRGEGRVFQQEGVSCTV